MTEPVVLIEKNRLGSGSSGASGGILHQAYSDRLLAGMSRDAIKTYAHMQSATGRSVGYRRTGVLLLADDGGGVHREQLEKDLEMHRSIGIVADAVNADEIRALCPGIEVADDAMGSFQPEGGFVAANRTIQTFATLARNAGVATRIGMTQPEVMVEKGRVVGVRTEEDMFEATTVVLSVGAWTPKMLSGLGVDLPLRMVRVEEHYLEMPPVDVGEDEGDFGEGQSGEFETRFMFDPLDLMPVPHPVLVDLEGDYSLRPDPRHARSRISRLDVGSAEVIDAPDCIGAEVGPEFTGWAREVASKRMPVYKDMEARGGAQSALVLTPDGLPIVSPVPGIEGLYLVAGFSGNDFHLAPSVGEGMAQMVLGQPVSAFDPDVFSATRF
ncbi:MAG: sarcosine oxidase subunit beta [Planctomycetota bacterium]